MIVWLDFSNKEMNILWHTGCKSFYLSQLERFEPLEDKDIDLIQIHEIEGGEAFLYWCDNFIEAKILVTLLEAHTIVTMPKLLWDTELNQCCVWSITSLLGENK